MVMADRQMKRPSIIPSISPSTPVEDLHVCDNANDRIRKIDRHTGLISTVFGDGQRSGTRRWRGRPQAASLLMPDAICFDSHDNLYVGEKYGFRIRKVEAATGIATTLVGNGVPGFGEEGLSGAETLCNSCEAGIWADPNGDCLLGRLFWTLAPLRRHDRRCYDNI